MMIQLSPHGKWSQLWRSSYFACEVQPTSIKSSDRPPSLPRGSNIAVIASDPSKALVLRAKVPSRAAASSVDRNAERQTRSLLPSRLAFTNNARGS